MRLIDRHPVASFFAIAYGITWGVYAVMIGLRLRADAMPGTPLLIIGIAGPTIAAIVVTGLRDGRRGVAELLRRALRWRVALRWYVFVLGFWAVGLLALSGLAEVIGLRTDGIDDPPMSAFPFLFVVILLIGGPLQEEFGWRGYALPRMQSGRSALRASAALGVAWGAWHIPIFWVAGTWHADLVSGRSMPATLYFVAVFVVSTVPLSVVYAWVYNSTASLLLTILMHAAMNTTDTWAPWPLDQSGAMAWSALQLGIFVVAATIAVAVAGPARLARRRELHSPQSTSAGLAPSAAPPAT